MKIKRFEDHNLNEGTVADFRDEMGKVSKRLHKSQVKEFYCIGGTFGDPKSVVKVSIPEEFRGDFEEVYTGGDYGQFFKDTAEFIVMTAEDMEANLILMDYEIDDFIKMMQRAKNSEAEEL